MRKIKYAVMCFSMSKHWMGPSVTAFDWGKWVAEKSHFSSFKEAQKVRDHLLKFAPEIDPQNLQVIQIAVNE